MVETINFKSMDDTYKLFLYNATTNLISLLLSGVLVIITFIIASLHIWMFIVPIVLILNIFLIRKFALRMITVEIENA